jgi:hypothetical protein
MAFAAPRSPSLCTSTLVVAGCDGHERVFDVARTPNVDFAPPAPTEYRPGRWSLIQAG